MKIFFCNRFSLFIVFVSVVTNVFAQKQNDAKSEWVYYDSKEKLVYKTLPAGDRIMDFSYAGYLGGGVIIPDVKEK
jgi:hypothetical protein